MSLVSFVFIPGSPCCCILVRFFRTVRTGFGCPDGAWLVLWYLCKSRLGGASRFGAYLMYTAGRGLLLGLSAGREEERCRDNHDGTSADGEDGGADAASGGEGYELGICNISI